MALEKELRLQLARQGTLTLDVVVTPRAPAAGIGDMLANGLLKIRVTAAPEKGRANEEVCALPAACLEVPARNLQVISGGSARRKRVRIVR